MDTRNVRGTNSNALFLSDGAFCVIIYRACLLHRLPYNPLGNVFNRRLLLVLNAGTKRVLQNGVCIPKK